MTPFYTAISRHGFHAGPYLPSVMQSACDGVGTNEAPQHLADGFLDAPTGHLKALASVDGNGCRHTVASYWRISTRPISILETALNAEVFA